MSSTCADVLAQFVKSHRLRDVTTYHSTIFRMKFFEQLQLLFTCETGKSVCRAHDTRLHLVHDFTPDINTAKDSARARTSVMCAEHIPEEHAMALCCSDMTIRLFSVDTYREKLIIRTPTQPLSMGWCGFVRRLYTTARDGVILGWDLTRRAMVQRLEGHLDMIMDMLAVPHHECLVTGGWQRKGGTCAPG